MPREIKVYKAYFKAIEEGRMKFWICKNQPEYTVDEEIILKEILPVESVERGHVQPGDREKFTGRSIATKVTFITEGTISGLSPGYVAIGIE